MPQHSKTIDESSGTEQAKSIRIGIRPIGTILGWALAAAITIQFFGAIKFLILGLLAASALAAMLHPIAKKLPAARGLSAIIVGLGSLLAFIGVLFFIGLLLVKPIRNEYQAWPQTREQLNQKIKSWSEKFGVDQPPEVQEVAINSIKSASSSGPQIVSGTASGVVDFMIVLLFVFVGAMYLLAEPAGRLTGPALPVLRPRHQVAIRAAISELEPQLRGWALGTLVGMLAVGIAAGIGYWLVGLKFAIPLALLTALSEIVPTVGPFVSFCVAVLFATLQGTSQVIGTMAVYAAVQSLESYVIVPLIMQRAVRIPPIVTLFTVVLWGKVFGIAGLIMAIPIDLTIWSLIDHLMIRPRRQREKITRARRGR